MSHIPDPPEGPDTVPLNRTISPIAQGLTYRPSRSLIMIALGLLGRADQPWAIGVWKLRVGQSQKRATPILAPPPFPRSSHRPRSPRRRRRRQARRLPLTRL